MAGGPPKNWHWRTKDCRPWAKEWFSQNALVSADGVKIDEVKDIVGDCELGMRKSKFVHIYDLSIDFTWSAGDDVAGTLRAIEVSHDMEESEYQFEGALTSGSGSQAEKHLATARKQLADKLRPVFQKFPNVMVEVHGKDIFEDNGTSAPTSGTHTPSTTTSNSVIGGSSVSSSTPAAAAGTTAKSGKAQNTATVRLESQFMVSASDLWDILTNDKRIPDWSRNAAKFKLVEDSDFELFGGNVSGKIVSFNAPTELVQRWTAPNWNGHFGTLTTTLSQGSDSTKLTLTLSGVPVGKEDETERNLDGFYLRALKQIGLGDFPTSFSRLHRPPPLVPLQKPRKPKHGPVDSDDDWGFGHDSDDSHDDHDSGPKGEIGRLGFFLSSVVPVLLSVGLIGSLFAAIWLGPSFQKPPK